MTFPATILPSNASAVERAIDRVFADHLESVPVDRIFNQWDPHKCPLSLLGWLAWAVSVDDWNNDWPEDVKRNVIANTIDAHRIKGTESGLNAALSALALPTRIREWTEDPQTRVPHTFAMEVELAERGVNVKDLNEIVRVATNAKNARSQFSGVTLISRRISHLFFAAAARITTRITIAPKRVPLMLEVPEYAAVGLHSVTWATIGKIQ